METSILHIALRDYKSFYECIESLTSQGCRDLGWLNDKKNHIPDNLYCTTAFSNSFGIRVEVDLGRRVFYSLDTKNLKS